MSSSHSFGSCSVNHLARLFVFLAFFSPEPFHHHFCFPFQIQLAVPYSHSFPKHLGSPFFSSTNVFSNQRSLQSPGFPLSSNAFGWSSFSSPFAPVLTPTVGLIILNPPYTPCEPLWLSPHRAPPPRWCFFNVSGAGFLPFVNNVGP